MTCVVPAPLVAGEVTVFAASSLTDVLQQIEPRFEDETGHELRLSLAGSSKLARQIQMGAPADVFISANVDWMDRLQHEGLIASGTRRNLLGNALVLIAHDPATPPVSIGPTLDLSSLLGDGRLAMGLVDAVPAGVYGKAALRHFDLWDGVAPKVAQAANVRAALSFVASGAAPYGIVYETDARAEDDVTIVARFPAGSHPRILYPVAAMATADGAAVTDFLAYLDTAESQAIFAEAGFSRPSD
nr:molybdate ABC transporter substrate-binding protein [Roseovarius bejariae]